MSLKSFLSVILILCFTFTVNVFAQDAPSSIPNNLSPAPPSAPNPAASFITLSPDPNAKPVAPAPAPAPSNLSKPGNVAPTTGGPTSISTSSSTTTTTTTTVEAKNQNPYMDDKLIVIGTGAVTGVYYPAGGAICRLINKDRKNLAMRCAVESTAGSIYNIIALKNAELDFAIIQSDWQDHAYNGTGYFAKAGKVDKLREVFSLHEEAFTVIVQKKSNLQKLDDLKGHTVNLGPEGSGVRATMEDLMKAKAWTKSDFKSLSEYKPDEQSKALCDGRVDALIIASGHPNGFVQEVTSLCETRILNVNDDVVQKFVSGNPELSTTVIPGGMYVGNPNDISTFGVIATFVTTTDVSDQIVYNVTKSVFENIIAFKALHPVFQQLDPKKMATVGRIAPVHEGALKYYREKGLAQ